MIARKRPRPQPDDDSDDEHKKCLRIVTFDSPLDSEIMEIKSFVSKLHKVSSPDRDYLVVYRVNGHFRAFNYLMEIMIESPTKENDQELKDGTVIYMLVERRYSLSKELLQRMLDLGLEVEEESTAALHLQTAFGKDKSNLLIVDSLLKTKRLSIHLVVYNEELAIPEQTAIGLKWSGDKVKLERWQGMVRAQAARSDKDDLLGVQGEKVAFLLVPKLNQLIILAFIHLVGKKSSSKALTLSSNLNNEPKRGMGGGGSVVTDEGGISTFDVTGTSIIEVDSLFILRMESIPVSGLRLSMFEMKPDDTEELCC
ncbi:hypothetical protein Tco_1243104 [Tanacetum coccineum]